MGHCVFSMSKSGIIGLFRGMNIVVIIIGQSLVWTLQANVLLDKLLMVLWFIFLYIASAVRGSVVQLLVGIPFSFVTIYFDFSIATYSMFLK